MNNEHIDDGGPAFPQDEPDLNSGHYNGRYEIHQHHSGMTLRDYFAGVALQGWLASYGEDATHPVDNDCALGVAGDAYQMADAMIAARNGGTSK